MDRCTAFGDALNILKSRVPPRIPALMLSKPSGHSMGLSPATAGYRESPTILRLMRCVVKVGGVGLFHRLSGEPLAGSNPLRRVGR